MAVSLQMRHVRVAVGFEQALRIGRDVKGTLAFRPLHAHPPPKLFDNDFQIKFKLIATRYQGIWKC